MRRPLAHLLGIVTVVAALSACDARQFPTYGGIGRPPIDVVSLAGTFDLKQVDGVNLPHLTSFGGTNYSLVSGTLQFHADSTWLFTTSEVVTGANGQTIGTSPANYTGTWTVTTTDSTINMRPSYGFMKSKGDTMFWKGGPRHSWEDSLTFTLVKR